MPEILRQAGEWWNGQPYRETQFDIDANGKRQRLIHDLPCLGDGLLPPSTPPPPEDHREEIVLRLRKIRDEKIARACGLVSEPRLPSIRMVKPGVPCIGVHALSGYSFGRSSLLAEEIPALAARGGLQGILLADTFSLTGAIEFNRIAQKVGITAWIGATIELPEGGEIVLVAKSSRGYVSLSRLITACHLNEPRLFPLASWERLEQHSSDLLCLTGGGTSHLNWLIAKEKFADAKRHVRRLSDLYGAANVGLQIERSYLPKEDRVNQRLIELAERTNTTAIAGGPITHAERAHFPVQDMITCVHWLSTIDGLVERKPRREENQPPSREFPMRALNAERFMRSAEELNELFADQPQLLEGTRKFMDRADPSVLPSRTRLPAFAPDEAALLRQLVTESPRNKLEPSRQKRIEFELERITRLGFSGHFLVAWDMCQWARSQRIHFSARGSVIDSVVAYHLGFSRIDALVHNLHFDRFLPIDGSKRPDIDIDFEAHRREDVRQYVTQKYGSDRVATVAAVGAYSTRGIIREVGKVMEIPEESIRYLAKRIHGGVSPERLEQALDARPELRDSGISRDRFRWVFRLAERMTDIPRNMRAHSSGIVISSEPLCDTVPIMPSGADGVPIIQWDKRSAKYYFDKFDVLCLRGQDVLSDTEEQIRVRDLGFSVEELPMNDEATYEAMRKGQLIGIPQSASPAMRQAHIRLGTQNLTDASLVQAGIRPGVGGAVKINELIARRRGKAFTYDHPEFERILGNTYGIIVFQEQVDQILQTFGGYSSGEAEDLREAIYKKRREEFAVQVRSEVLQRMVDHGFAQAIAEQAYEYVAGFNGYGFAQGHALAFAEISIRCIYCQQNFPAPYFAALLNAQPAGYYGPKTIANEARIRGVPILGLDVNRSDLKFRVETIHLHHTSSGPALTSEREGAGGEGRSANLIFEKPPSPLNYDEGTDSNFDPPLQLSRPSPWGVGRVTDSSQTWLSVVKEDITLPPPLTIEDGAIRVALSQVYGVSKATQERILCVREEGPFTSFFDFVARVNPARDELESLILGGGFDSLHPNRRALLWSIPEAMNYASSINGQVPGTLSLRFAEPTLVSDVKDMSLRERALFDRQILGLDVDCHIMAFERHRIKEKGGKTSHEAGQLKPGTKAFAVGNPIRLRFPPTKSGKRVVFFDLEDETGLLNVTCFDDVYVRDGHAIVCFPYVTVVGEAQDRDGHIAFLAHHVYPFRPQINEDLPADRKLPFRVADFLVG